MLTNKVIPSSEPQTVTLDCKVCGGAFEWVCPPRKDIAPALFDGDSLRIVPGMCYECAKPTKRKPYAKVQWEHICPPMYQDTEPGKLPNQSASNIILEWKYNPKGLLIHGKTGSGKTRTVWLLILKILEAGKTVTAYDCTGFGQKVREKFMQGRGAEVQWLQWLVDADVFFLDDLGKEKLTDRVAEQLHALLEKRSSALKPTIFTTEFTGVDLENRFDERGPAFVRRLREYCQCIGL